MRAKVRSQGDFDRDGVVDVLDLDDDGDLILDDLDARNAARPKSTRASRQAQARHYPGGCGANNVYCPSVSTNLPHSFETTLNVNAGSSDAQIDGDLAGHFNFALPTTTGTVELDCGDPDTGLVYCRRNGSTGSIVTLDGGAATGQLFPSCCDADGDGFGLMDLALIGGPPGSNGFFLADRTSTQNVRAGDVMIERVTIDGVESTIPAPVQFVFATVPALVSYTDDAGHQATITYPVGFGSPGVGPTNGFPVSDSPMDADADVEVTLTFWRPQRRAVSGVDPAGATWMDIGHLTYGIHPSCPQSAYSTNDPELVTSLVPIQPGLTDKAPDRLPNASNTVSYTVNLSRCDLIPNVGDTATIRFIARGDAPDTAEQHLVFTHASM